jgi:hypothetical protein
MQSLYRSGLYFIPKLLVAACWSIVTVQFPVMAREQDLQKFVDSIESVNQVKEDLKTLLIQSDQCKVGSCFNATRTTICSTVAALDVQVNGQIIGDWKSVGSEGKIPITKPDLSLMKTIFSQCKPTNYQYWNWGTMLHVYYVPSPAIDRQVRQALGVPEKARSRQS